MQFIGSCQYVKVTLSITKTDIFDGKKMIYQWSFRTWPMITACRLPKALTVGSSKLRKIMSSCHDTCNDGNAVYKVFVCHL